MNCLRRGRSVRSGHWVRTGFQDGEKVFQVVPRSSLQLVASNQSLDTGKTNTALLSRCGICFELENLKRPDTIDRTILIEKWEKYGFANFLLDLMILYLTERQRCVNFNGVMSALTPVKIGVSQGSILGSFFFFFQLQLHYLRNPLRVKVIPAFLSLRAKLPLH